MRPSPPGSPYTPSPRRPQRSISAADGEYDVTRLQAAVGGPEIDWEEVWRIVGDYEVECLGDVPTPPARGECEVIEGVLLVNGVDEGAVLASFYDQGDAKALLASPAGRDAAVAEHHKDYIDRMADADIARIHAEADGAFRSECERRAALRRREGEADSAMEQIAANDEDRAQYATALKAITRLHTKIAELDSDLVQTETALAYCRSVSVSPSPRREGTLRGRVSACLVECVDEARWKERLEVVVEQLRHDMSDLALREFAGRRSIEQEHDHAVFAALRLYSTAVAAHTYRTHVHLAETATAQCQRDLAGRILPGTGVSNPAASTTGAARALTPRSPLLADARGGTPVSPVLHPPLP